VKCCAQIRGLETFPNRKADGGRVKAHRRKSKSHSWSFGLLLRLRMMLIAARLAQVVRHILKGNDGVEAD
jgi:hypothetical protein